MKSFLKILGLIIVLLGVACLVVYYFYMKSNNLLWIGLALEVVGALLYIILNRVLDK